MLTATSSQTASMQPNDCTEPSNIASGISSNDVPGVATALISLLSEAEAKLPVQVANVSSTVNVPVALSMLVLTLLTAKLSGKFTRNWFSSPSFEPLNTVVTVAFSPQLGSPVVTSVKSTRASSVRSFEIKTGNSCELPASSSMRKLGKCQPSSANRLSMATVKVAVPSAGISSCNSRLSSAGVAMVLTKADAPLTLPVISICKREEASGIDTSRVIG